MRIGQRDRLHEALYPGAAAAGRPARALEDARRAPHHARVSHRLHAPWVHESVSISSPHAQLVLRNGTCSAGVVRAHGKRLILASAVGPSSSGTRSEAARTTAEPTWNIVLPSWPCSVFSKYTAVVASRSCGQRSPQELIMAGGWCCTGGNSTANGLLSGARSNAGGGRPVLRTAQSWPPVFFWSLLMVAAVLANF